VSVETDAEAGPVIESSHALVELVRPPAWLMSAALLLAAATLAGLGLVASLAPHYPLWLIALNPLPRHLILVAPHTPLLPFVAVAALRGLFGCFVAFELGRCYGPQGVASFELGGPSRAGRVFRLATEAFGRWSGVLLLVFPGVMTSALAGAGGLQRKRALALSALGLIAWALVNHRLGGLLAPWTVPILRFVEENMLAATLLCCAGVLAYYAFQRRKFRGEVD
jgi:membrane protein DedA with SNARE-associated domain